MEFPNQFIHHVFFWLHRPDNLQDRDLLTQGLRTLVTIPGIQRAHIGIPAGTPREVVDSSYAVSWLAVFDDAAAQDAYQVDPVHLKFVEECGRLWNKVVVTDSVPA
jgi:hypothetical protein